MRNVTMTAGTMTGVDTAKQFNLHGDITVNAAATSSVISTAQINLSPTSGVSASATQNTFTVADGAAATDLSVSSVVAGTSGLIKAGAGVMSLSGVNTYTGATTISAGTLELGGVGRLGSGTYAGAISNSGTLLINTTANQTLSGTLTGAGSLVKNNTGILTLSTPKTYTGATTVSGGELIVNGTGTLSGTSALTVATNATFTYLPPTVGTSLTLGAGSTLNRASSSTVGLNWNAATSSRIAAAGAATIGTGVKVSMTGAYTSGTPYTILTAGSGLNTGSYVAINNTDYTAAFTLSPTSVIMTPTTTAPLAAAFWKGGASGYASVLGVAGNWTTDGAGTASALTPGAAANVYFSDSGAVAGNQVNMTLGSNMALNSITVNGVMSLPFNTNPVSVLSTGGYSLTLGSTTGSGITMNLGAGAVTLDPAIALGNAQTWTNNASSTLTVNGVVSGWRGHPDQGRDG
ncbi:MAG: autotransporter-associated beta strand repeat-containing protein [Kiritimatiellia bacterium]